MKKTAFLFDLDGVITDTAPYHLEAWQALANQLGITFDLAFNEQLKGISRRDSLQKILALDPAKRTFSEAELASLAEQKNEHYLSLLRQLTPAAILPGVANFLKAATDLGIPCVLASASQNAPSILERLQLAEAFTGIVDPTTLKNGKPDPEIFLRAAALAGVPPEACIGFEDAQAGVAAIRAAGCKSVGVIAESQLSGCDKTIQTFDEITPAGIYQELLSSSAI